MIRGRVALTLAALAAAWAASIFWVSSQPNPFPYVPSAILSHDKVLHACAYALLGFLVRGALAGTRFGARAALVLAVFASTAYGASDEWHQSFVPNRTADVFDLAADALGAAAGAALAAVVLRRRGSRASIRA